VRKHGKKKKRKKDLERRRKGKSNRTTFVVLVGHEKKVGASFPFFPFLSLLFLFFFLFSLFQLVFLRRVLCDWSFCLWWKICLLCCFFVFPFFHFPSVRLLSRSLLVWDRSFSCTLFCFCLGLAHPLPTLPFFLVRANEWWTSRRISSVGNTVFPRKSTERICFCLAFGGWNSLAIEISK